MNEFIKLIIGIIALLLAYPIGIILKKVTKDEQKKGKIYFLILTIISLVSGLIGLIIKIDWLLFTGFFFAIVSSQSLKE